ncbi:MAG: hypothetical protein APF77_12790 [Clostridia bacterium BRH_c25]|nr:MAG: hypothetical protein APF77_12790 [Clostridia bacterium BRH_c25]
MNLEEPLWRVLKENRLRLELSQKESANKRSLIAHIYLTFHIKSFQMTVLPSGLLAFFPLFQ